MKLKKILMILISIIIFSANITVFNTFLKDNNAEKKIKIEYFLKSDKSDRFQLFYKNEPSSVWDEKESITKVYSDLNNYEKMVFEIPVDSKYIRLDFGNSTGKFLIKGLKIKYVGEVPLRNIDRSDKKNEIDVLIKDDKIEIISRGGDPFLELNIEDVINKVMSKRDIKVEIFKCVLCLLLAIMVSVGICNYKYTIDFLGSIYQNKEMLFSLSKNDFKTKYVSSYLGGIWAFIQPLVLIGTYWFVFQVGFRSTDVGDIPFIVWFICGIIPWFFFSEALSSGSNSLIEYSYLVKKIVFEIEALPLVKIVSAFFVHLFFVVFMFIIYRAYGLDLSIHNIQIIYYTICIVLLLTSLTMITSCIILFFRDLNQIIAIILNVGFWFTPIGWSYKMLPHKWLIVFKLNPMYYIVEGYRDTFINKIWFFEKPYQTIYFWVFIMTTLLIGVKLFKKLKVHFADVL